MNLPETLPPETLPLRAPSSALPAAGVGNLIISRRPGETLVIDWRLAVAVATPAPARSRWSRRRPAGRSSRSSPKNRSACCAAN